MNHWDDLNLEGRIGARKWYRTLRNMGHNRHQTRCMMINVGYGLGMAKYWMEQS